MNIDDEASMHTKKLQAVTLLEEYFPSDLPSAECVGPVVPRPRYLEPVSRQKSSHGDYFGVKDAQ
jgi:hypothetical protein